jgi:hypothetical protein
LLAVISLDHLQPASLDIENGPPRRDKTPRDFGAGQIIAVKEFDGGNSHGGDLNETTPRLVEVRWR